MPDRNIIYLLKAQHIERDRLTGRDPGAIVSASIDPRPDSMGIPEADQGLLSIHLQQSHYGIRPAHALMNLTNGSHHIVPTVPLRPRASQSLRQDEKNRLCITETENMPAFFPQGTRQLRDVGHVAIMGQQNSWTTSQEGLCIIARRLGASRGVANRSDA
jgi:hypothetical protein